MTFTVPRPVLIGLAILVILAVGVVGTLLVTGGGGDHSSTAASTSSTIPAQASPAFGSADLEALDHADTAMQDSVESFRTGLSACVALAASNQLAAVADCFQRKYAPYEAAITSLQFQFRKSVDKATGECGSDLAEAQAALVASKAASNSLRDAFTSQNFGAASVGAFGSKFDQYRNTMDRALVACTSAVPGYSVTKTP